MQRFTDKKILTNKVNMPGWIIYRDSINGMYARNDILGVDHCLNAWNITLKNPHIDRWIDIIRDELNAIEDENFGKKYSCY